MPKRQAVTQVLRAGSTGRWTVVSRGTEGGIMEVVDRMTVEAGLAENGAIGWTRMKWT